MSESMPLRSLRRLSYLAAWVVCFPLIVPLAIVRGIVAGIVGAWRVLEP